MLVIYLYIAFFAINMYNTEPFDSFQTITGKSLYPFILPYVLFSSINPLQSLLTSALLSIAN